MTNEQREIHRKKRILEYAERVAGRKEAVSLLRERLVVDPDSRMRTSRRHPSARPADCCDKPGGPSRQRQTQGGGVCPSAASVDPSSPRVRIHGPC